MAWNYAELSKAAKVSGGPEQLIEKLIEFGKITGKKEMIPVIGGVAVLSVFATIGIQKVIGFFEKEKQLSILEIEKTKQELIQGIKDYDEQNENIDNLEEVKVN